MIRMLRPSFVSAGFVISLCVAAFAAVPNRITYQGRLMKSGLTASGLHTFNVAFVSNTTGQSYTANPLSVTLPASGDFTLIIEIPTGVDFSQDSYKLKLTVDTVSLSPPDEFTAVPYALVTATAAYSLSAASAQTAQGLSIPLPAAQVQLNGTTTLDVWQSTTTPTKINAAQIDGSLPGQWQWSQGTGMLTYTGGKVGIGTATPATSLDVEGGVITAGGGLVIETRTSDPTTPSAGRMWLRTDQ
jgi:hypothetical protein